MPHPELVRIENLVRRLDEGSRAPDPEESKKLYAAAGEYAELCRKANDRLQTCVEILSSGRDKEYQALMTASRPPDLLDLCALLGEIDTDQYRAFCRANRFPLPDPIDERAKQTVDPVYAKADTFQQKLMGEFSAANSKRDFREALRIIRQVGATQPDDANSAKQAKSLEDRLLRESVAKLEDALREGDEEGVLALLAEIEETAPGRMPEEGSSKEKPWTEALVLRAGLLRDRAAEESAFLVATADAAKRDDKLDEALEALSRIEGLRAEHGFDLSETDRGLYGGARRWADEQLRKIREEQEFRDRLTGLETTVRTVKDKEFRNEKPELEELRTDALAIRKQWKEIAEYGKPVDSTLQDEARKVLATLEEKVALKQRARRRNLIAAASAAGGLVVVLALVAFFFWKSSVEADLLDRAVAGERATDVERRLANLKDSRVPWRGFGALPGAFERAGNWLDRERATAARVDGMVTAVENDLAAVPEATGWTPVSLAALRRSLDDAFGQAENVNADFRADLDERLAAIDRNFDRITEEKRNEIAPAFHEKVLELDRLVRGTLSGPKAPAESEAAFAEMSTLVAELDAMAGVELEELKPLAADLTTFGILKERYETLEASQSVIREAFAAIRSAGSLEEYAAALEQLDGTGFLEGTDKIGLGNLLRKIRSEEAILREILMPGDLVIWTRMEEGEFSADGFPESVEGPEKALYLGLRDDESLSAIYVYTATESGKTRTIYSRGDPLDIQESQLGPIKQTVATGDEVYDPARSGDDEATFVPASYRRRVASSGNLGYAPEGGGLSPESTLFARLRLADYVDPTITRYRDTLLEPVEELLADQGGASPLFKAYVHLQLGELLMARKSRWLVEFGDFERDLAQLRALTAGRSLKSSSWMLPERQGDLAPALEEYYAELRGRRYAGPAKALHQFHSRMRTAGLRFVGHVNHAAEPALLTPVDKAERIWGISAKSTIVPLLEHAGGEREVLTEPEMFTPLFVLPEDPAAVLAASAEAAGVDPGDPQVLERIPPLLRTGAH